ncbi:dienelactone hydrolase family protein [Thermopolyspora sp. NPDC052614]|uniref:dienelactone hydrolase family protein n=1 Tax=Thermopolyspora sp. NPDC052614 TaxID=3155682 RepID=UPI003443E1AA
MEENNRPLDGWDRWEFTAHGITHPVYRRGSGPCVILLPEMPGMTPEVMTLAGRLVTAGFTVAVPSLVGTPGRAQSTGYTLSVAARVCVSREFRAFARDENRPVAAYLRALAKHLHGELGGPGVGIVGMCFSGGFALAAAVEPAVLASVLSQPSIPFPVTRAARRDPGCSREELAAVRDRARRGEFRAAGLRFSHDRAVPPERFAALRAALGPAFEVIEIDSGPGNPHGFPPSAHTVLTGQYVDKPGHPTVEALQRVVNLLRSRLAPE